ncbi:hypothetical protein [Mycobacteroides abscessus]|uniref:hypothetical protein n=1 Tax=Mycobacteroides abscessus TaxID=36809 RepID=UPI0009A6017F|nr:hypothetical protein [Mycobacteroides abscessus]SLJ61055.1 Uncharacterised protein [Mycobacteroides abscessus subsp. abscessus]
MTNDPGSAQPRPPLSSGDEPADSPRKVSGVRAACCALTGTAGVAGSVVGSVACMVSMGLVAVGAGSSAAAAGMAGMSTSGHTPSGPLGALVRIGPVLLIVSIVLVTVAFALRRRLAAVPALIAGVVMYAAMYAQPSLTVMYTGLALGYATWIGLFLWLRTRARHRPPGAPVTPS